LSSSLTDNALIAAVRAGHTESYGVLYIRHVSAARGLARALVPVPADADDLVSEAFVRVLNTLRQGRGPATAFRPYVLTTVRHVCYDRSRRDRRFLFTDDLTRYERNEPYIDPTVAELDRSYAAQAFAKLPERWRRVLWYTEVEGGSPNQVADLLGLTPGGVAALAYRARERLRQMYLQEHVTRGGDPRCHWTAGRLGAAVRGALRPRERSKVDHHLDTCPPCQLRRRELAELNAALKRYGHG